MAGNEIEIDVRIEFFRDIHDPHSLDAAIRASERVGAVSRSGVRALCVPRVGDFVLAFNPWTPFPFSPVAYVEHTLREPPEHLPASERIDSPPSVMVVIRAPWHSDAPEKFTERGWIWLAHNPD